MIWALDPTIKPEWGTPLDPEHPLAAGLLRWVPFNEGMGPPDDLAPRGQPGSFTGSPAWVSTPAGPGLYCVSGASVDLDYRANLAAGAFSLHLRFRPLTYTGTYTALIDKGNSVTRECSVFFNTSGNIQYWSFGVNDFDGGFGGAFTTGTVWDLTVTRDVNNLTTFYKNGIPFYSITRAGTGTLAGAPLCLGRNPTTGGTLPEVDYLLLGVWTGRCLSAGEVAYLVAAPYGVHASSPLRFVDLTAGGGGGGGFLSWYSGGGHGAMLGSGIMGG